VDEETGELAGDTKISIEEVEKKAREVARQEAVSIRKDELLGQIDDEEDRKVVEHYVDKLTTGEDVNLKNIGTHFKAAYNASGIEGGGNRIMDIMSSSSGKPPRRVEKREEVLEDSTAKDLANQMGIKIEAERK
jgi:hypothetical protein